MEVIWAENFYVYDFKHFIMITSTSADSAECVSAAFELQTWEIPRVMCVDEESADQTHRFPPKQVK